MIEGIANISNIGTFHAFAPEQPVALRKLTLIYGPNGTGKTTLCAILRSLARNDPAILQGRKTLNRDGASRVELVLSDGGRCVWDGERWIGHPPKLEIFDEQFVRDNLYTDVVEVDHKRNLYRVIVGEAEVDIANQIGELTKKADEKQNEIRRLKTELNAIVNGKMPLETFVGLVFDPAIDGAIDAQEKAVAAHENAEKLKREKGLDPLPIPEPVAGLEELLGRSFADLASDAEQRLRQYLERCGNKEGHRHWLEAGLSYVADDACPFCGQSLAAAAGLIEAYRTVFDERYRKHKEAIEAAIDDVDERFGEAAAERLRKAIVTNKERAQFWQSFVPADWSQLEQDPDWDEPWSEYYKAAKAKLDHKQQAPLEPVPVEQVRAARERLEDVLPAFRKRNEQIAEFNRRIEKVKGSASAEAIGRAKEELERLRLVKKRHDPEVVDLCDDYSKARRCKSALEKHKGKLEKLLDININNSLLQCRDRKNKLLQAFGADFLLKEIKKTQPSGQVAAGWTIEIRDTPIDPSRQAPLSEPSFKNTLSAGDRSALAFAFFLAQLEQKPDLAERVVVTVKR